MLRFAANSLFEIAVTEAVLPLNAPGLQLTRPAFGVLEGLAVWCYQGSEDNQPWLPVALAAHITKYAVVPPASGQYDAQGATGRVM